MIIPGNVLTTGATITLGPDGVASLHARDLPQKDFLCGCFWTSIVLRASGADDSVDQDRVALEAGAVLPDGDVESVPPGEAERRDYRIELPKVTPAVAGTAAPALARAVTRLSNHRLAAVPVAGPWSEESVGALVEAVAEVAPSTSLVANVRTGPLWGSRPHPSSLLAHLNGENVEPPPADWDTGHFVNVAALVHGPARKALVVRDSYRSLGAEGYHLQPADAFARALARGDGREGGILCICPAEDEEPLRTRLGADSYELRHWDNGTPAPVGERSASGGS
jgi:hypothetical protein